MIGIPHVDKEKPKGIWLNCSECLYGSSANCPGGIMRLCGDYLGWESRDD